MVVTVQPSGPDRGQEDRPAERRAARVRGRQHDGLGGADDGSADRALQGEVGQVGGEADRRRRRRPDRRRGRRRWPATQAERRAGRGRSAQAWTVPRTRPVIRPPARRGPGCRSGRDQRGGEAAEREAGERDQPAQDGRGRAVTGTPGAGGAVMVVMAFSLRCSDVEGRDGAGGARAAMPGRQQMVGIVARCSRDQDVETTVGVAAQVGVGEGDELAVPGLRATGASPRSSCVVARSRRRRPPASRVVGVRGERPRPRASRRISRPIARGRDRAERLAATILVGGRDGLGCWVCGEHG